jgi:hypothetical protein
LAFDVDAQRRILNLFKGQRGFPEQRTDFDSPFNRAFTGEPRQGPARGWKLRQSPGTAGRQRDSQLRMANSTLRAVFRRCAPVSFTRQVKTLPKTSSTGVEAQLMEAQARLQRLCLSGDVSETATLVHLGAFEVRLLRPMSASPEGPARFWLELFDHDRQFSIDSIGTCNVEDAVIAADEFIARATKLSENSHSWRRST